MVSMARVVLTPEADRQLHKLPRVIRYRLHDVVDRLERWPETSGAKPLRNELKGHYRIRTGDFRVLFRVVADEIWIVRIEHRKDVYED
jgi:mRNA interferase RelE/StbE